MKILKNLSLTLINNKKLKLWYCRLNFLGKIFVSKSLWQRNMRMDSIGWTLDPVIILDQYLVHLENKREEDIDPGFSKMRVGVKMFRGKRKDIVYFFFGDSYNSDHLRLKCLFVKKSKTLIYLLTHNTYNKGTLSSKGSFSLNKKNKLYRLFFLNDILIKKHTYFFSVDIFYENKVKYFDKNIYRFTLYRTV